ncbi:selenide, water dikinase [Thermobrachium celere]|nr:selenide, water dikinase [Thermobrachium celere]
MYDKNLIVGIDTSDDAAVYKINEETAIIHTVDFFTPVVDDPYIFGQIAATNSLSDIYAMGGDVLLALNIACFPSCKDPSILAQILKGGADKVIEANGIIAGGHTIDDDEPKYGLSVLGIINPQKVLSNANVKPGDVLILTKPIGTGIINTAIKGEIATKNQIDAAIKIMSTLNKYASDIAKKYNVNSCTDITGFGLGGHLYEMAKGSGVSIHIEWDSLKLIEGVEELAKMGIIPAGTYRNKSYLKDKFINLRQKDYIEDIVFDPQTSGGLVFSLDSIEAFKLLDELNKCNVQAFIVGYATEYDGKYIYIE